MGVQFTVERTGRSVTTVRTPFNDSKDWEQWFLLRADAHHDNPDCDRKMEYRHLDLAVERGAGIIDVGDTFCAMQGKFDKRSDKSYLRDEHRGGDYLDALVRTTADDYQKYAENWVQYSTGNHESAIRKHHETDLIERLVATINDRKNTHIQAMGYSGWVRFMFKRGKETASKRLWYIHGYAGGGPVTKDTIQANRQLVYISNADIILSGHTHDKWILPIQRIMLNGVGNVKQFTTHCVKTGSYKDEYKDGHGGWHIETGKPPKPKGAWWLRFFFTDHDRIDFEFMEAR